MLQRKSLLTVDGWLCEAGGSWFISTYMSQSNVDMQLSTKSARYRRVSNDLKC